MDTKTRIGLLNPKDVIFILETIERGYLESLNELLTDSRRLIAADIRKKKTPGRIRFPKNHTRRHAGIVASTLLYAHVVARLGARYEVSKHKHFARSAYPDFDFTFDDAAAVETWDFASTITVKQAEDIWQDLMPDAGLDWYKNYSLALVAETDEKILAGVRGAILESVKRGYDTRKAMSAVSAYLGNETQYYLERVVRTEVAKVYEQGRIQEFDATPEITGYEVSAILDTRLCHICRAREGVQIPKGELEKYRLTPPYHPFCRCIFLPIFVWEEKAGEIKWKKLAKDAPDVAEGFGGKDMQIPGAKVLKLPAA
jgi:SPP1 gp7 family putative phage head morphogenesis protein